MRRPSAVVLKEAAHAHNPTPSEGIVKKLSGLLVVCVGLLVCAPGASAATITVNTTVDPNPALDNDGVCTLREAIAASNTDTASGATAGECASGSGVDTIDFDDAIFTGSPSTSTIALSVGSSLPPMIQSVTVDGENCGCPAPCVGIDANDSSVLALSDTAPNSEINGVAVFDAGCPTCVAIRSDADGVVVRNTWLGMSLNQTATSNQNQTGFLISGDSNTIGGTTANDRNVIAATATAAVRIVGSSNTRVQGNYMGTKANGITTGLGVGNFNGVQVVGDTAIPAPPPVGTLIGGPEAGAPGVCDAPCNVIATNVSSDITLASTGATVVPAGQTRIEGNFVGLGATGTDLGTGGINVGAADDVTVGGDAARRNYVTTAIEADAGATNLDVVDNFVGLNPAGVARFDDSATIKLGAFGSPVVAPTITGNRIASANAGGANAAIHAATTNATVQGNTIGIGTGGENVGGGSSGIFLNGGSGNQIGGTGPGEGNVIGNAGTGILAAGDATITGNVLGTDSSETQSHPITANGIQAGGDGNVIGGTTAASENLIVNVTGSNPTGDAIALVGDGADLNRILRNRGSAAAGEEFVELRGVFGPGNGGSGPNNGIERPVITAGATSLQVSGTGAVPGATVRVYRTTSAAGSSGPQNVTAFAGQATADGSGNWTLNCPSAGCEAGLPGAGQVTANQTAANGDSSEMADPKPYTDQPPETTITSGPGEGATTHPNPQFGFVSSEPGSTFQCQLDGGGFANCSSPHAIGPLGNGPHTLEVRATDSTANPDTTPATRNFVVDATAPDTQIDSGPAGGGTTADSTPTLGFSATEGGSTFECRFDGGSFAGCSGPGAEHTPAALTDGQHTFEVRAVDAVGNADASPAGRTFTVDTTAPETTIDSGPAAGSTTGDPASTFGFSSSETGSTFECRVDDAAFGPCGGPGSAHTTAPLSDGQHTFEVRATDAVGNPDQSPASRTFTVDAVPDSGPSDPGGAADDDPPETTITRQPKDRLKVSKTATVKYEFRSDEAGSTFRCELDGKALASCSSPLTLKKLKRGKHTFSVTAVDAAGNGDPTPATDSFKVKRKKRKRG